MALLNISQINSLADDQFVSIFGNVIELCPDAAVQVKKKGPFRTVSELCEAFHKYLDDLTEEGKLSILKLHPDLAGNLTRLSELTRESAGEQRSAGLTELSDWHVNVIQSSNQRYKTKFGFPFIICARENKFQSIIEGLQHRYDNTREQEIATGINEVKKICKLRILDIAQLD
ncbi:2-oxo-4-hydroxy-4-carboxy-5-ureidoimidazoline decarboxylase-like [Hyposmocoma kahamanoa]|uniref:2-oxo-4-hydroxy-4-carboxy-5-ureidoimidazoline decarboxylase-like n=1 Tax=Hyposmocoma kahamanoa TaxID=1477025 RepID=UPI000E6D9F40|nr:2-oxo-4-hydroxy-4-carboxy-5-ureidoimidazoline decarboxylase-like [Hyposmocoma kahamanoa]